MLWRTSSLTRSQPLLAFSTEEAPIFLLVDIPKAQTNPFQQGQQAPAQDHHAGGQVSIGNHLGAAGQIKVISPRALYPLAHVTN